ncbi:MAG: DUF1176 domain-containing protein [Leptolyngbyaceae cyanobacterium bins.349]|nr:DUF1176 domain-containing protein [Leptolyngbyaceae cyanobacterium bins.349]
MKFTPIVFAISLCLTSILSGFLPGLIPPAEATSPAKPATAEENQAVSQLLQNSKRFKVCADSLNLESAKRASRAYKVDNQTYFVMVQCFLAAYQGNYEFFLYAPKAKGNVVKPLSLTEFTQNQAGKVEKVESTSIGGLPTFNPNQRILTVRTKYRGLGDCGSNARYRLDNEALKLLDFKAKFACDGKMAPYSQIFPAK